MLDLIVDLLCNFDKFFASRLLIFINSKIKSPLKTLYKLGLKYISLNDNISESFLDILMFAIVNPEKKFPFILSIETFTSTK